MRKTVKRIVSLTLIAAMVVAAFSGCGKKSKNVNTINKDTIYKEEACSVNLPDGFSINNMVISDEKLYISGYLYDETTGESKNPIYITDENGSNLMEYDISSDQCWVVSMTSTGEGGIYILLNEYIEDYSDPDNYVYEEAMYLVKVDENGKEISKVKVTDDAKEMTYVERMVSLGGQGAILFSGTQYALYDSSLKFVKAGELEGSDINWISDAFLDKNNNLYVRYYANDGYVVKMLDSKTMKLGETVDLKAVENYSFYPGNSKYDIIAMFSNTVYGYNIGDAEPTPLMNLVDSDIATNYFTSLAAKDDGSFIGGYSEWDANDQYSAVIAKYTKVPADQVVDKKIISLGCIYLDGDIKKQVIAYNKKNDTYRITVKDYSVYQTDDDWEAGTKKLNADIAAGQAPDIIVANSPSIVKNYASKGLFADLYKYIEKDESINKDDIFPNLLKVSEYNGKLYQIAPYFNISSLAAKTKFVGNRNSWTFSEMMEVEKSLPEGTSLFMAMDRVTLLRQILFADSEFYIDMSKGKCNFDSQEFKDLLTYMKGLPKSYEDIYNDIDDSFWAEYDSSWRNDKAVIYNAYINTPNDYRDIVKGYLGEDATYIGYPTSEGNGTVINFYLSFAISSKASNPDGAWDFVKYYLSKDYQDSITYNIPASMSRFDEICEQAKNVNTEGGDFEIYKEPFWMGNGYVELDPINDDDIAAIKAVILSAEKLEGNVEDEVIDIIIEEAEPFFEGQKSVDEVTSIIQSRISIYISEKQ